MCLTLLFRVTEVLKERSRHVKLIKYVNLLRAVRKLSGSDSHLGGLGDHLRSDSAYNRVLKTIRSTPNTKFRSSLNKLVFDRSELTSGSSLILHSLKSNGIVIIENFLGEQELQNLDVAINEIHTITSEVTAGTAEVLLGESVVALQTTKHKRFSGYNEMARLGEPVITLRGGRDKGMLDLFNVNLLPISNRDAFVSLLSMLTSEELLKLIEQYNPALTAVNLNLYLNNGITETRGPHFDDLNATIKGFVYLRDVENLESGPFCYAPGSNNISYLHAGSMALNPAFASLATDCNTIAPEALLPCFGKKGTLILSDQTGIHFGFPQSLTGSRVAAVMRYALK